LGLDEAMNIMVERCLLPALFSTTITAATDASSAIGKGVEAERKGGEMVESIGAPLSSAAAAAAAAAAAGAEAEKKSGVKGGVEGGSATYHTEACVFYDGDRPLFDDASLSLSPDVVTMRWKHHAHPTTYPTDYATSRDSATPTSIRELAPHKDDSDMTINLCIGGDFSGGQVHFHGHSHTTHPSTTPSPSYYHYQHRVNYGVAHAGEMLHSSTASVGSRWNLLLFMKKKHVVEPLAAARAPTTSAAELTVTATPVAAAATAPAAMAAVEAM